MKKTFLFLALILLSAPAFVAVAKVENVPALQKAPLKISNVQVETTVNGTTISWSTNKPARGSVLVAEVPPGYDAVGYPAEEVGTYHEVVIQSLIEGRTYEIRIESSDAYGYSDTLIRTFTAR